MRMATSSLCAARRCRDARGVNGGSDVTWTAGQHCYETPVGSASPSTCEPKGTACPVVGSFDWQCEEAIDCVGSAAGPHLLRDREPDDRHALRRDLARVDSLHGYRVRRILTVAGYHGL